LKNILLGFYNMFNPYRGLSKEIYILAIGRVINAAGTFVFPLLTLILTQKVHMSSADAGILLSASGIVFMLSGIIGGKLSDHIGRKKIIIIFNTLGASGYIAAAVMGMSMTTVMVILFSGFVMGIADPASGALVADITTPKNRDSAYSLFYMAMNLGFAISPLIGGLLFNNYLEILFVADAVTAFIAMILILKFIPETINKNDEELGEDRKLEARVKGSIFKVLLERPILIFYAVVLLGYNFVYSQWGFMYPIHAELVAPGDGAKLYGTLMSFNAIIVITLTPLLTKLLSSKKSLRRIVYGGFLYTIGFGLPGFLDRIPFLFVSVFILTVGEIVVTTSTMPFIANHTPASHRGRMNAVLPLIMGFGYMIGPLITGNVSNTIGINGTWRIVGLIMITFTALAYLLEKYDMRTSATENTIPANE
jgi:MFS family permease